MKKIGGNKQSKFNDPKNLSIMFMFRLVFSLVSQYVSLMLLVQMACTEDVVHMVLEYPDLASYTNLDEELHEF